MGASGASDESSNLSWATSLLVCGDVGSLPLFCGGLFLGCFSGLFWCFVCFSVCVGVVFGTV